MNAFKNQQYRWAKGSIQTAKKLLPRILASPLPVRVKIEAAFHLTANLAYPLMVLLSALMLPSMMIRYGSGWGEMLLVDVPLFFLATASVTTFYWVSQREIDMDWKRSVKVIPFLMSVGIGISLNNARAVIDGFIGRDAHFVRTPKHRIESASDRWEANKYRGKVGVQPLAEIALGLNLTLAVGYAVAHQVYGTLPFLVLFQIGFLYSGLVSLLQGRSLRLPVPPNQKSVPRIA
jgi:hypothetical protein